MGGLERTPRRIAQRVLRPIAGTFTAGAVILFSPDTIPSSAFETPELSPSASTRTINEVFPETRAQTITPNLTEATACKPPVIIFKGGLGQNPDGYLSVPLMRRTTKVAESYGVTIENNMPQNLEDPETSEWTQSFIKKLTEIRDRGQKADIIAFSNGGHQALLDLREVIKNHPDLIPVLHRISIASVRNPRDGKKGDYPKRPNYDASFKSPHLFTEGDMQTFKETFGKDTVFLANADDTIISAEETEKTAREMGGSFILVHTQTPSGHFATEESGE